MIVRPPSADDPSIADSQNRVDRSNPTETRMGRQSPGGNRQRYCQFRGLVQHSSQDDETAVTATDVGRTGRHAVPGQKRAGGKRPDGQITWAIRRPSVQPLVKKYSALFLTQITGLSWASRPHERGVSRSSRTLGRDAMDAISAADESAVLRTAKSCGPDAPMLASNL